ncbi:AAEL011947-PA, partial [Aedes aegypti]
PQPICNLEDLTRVVVTRDDDVSNTVTVFINPDRVINFSMEDRDACEFAIVLAGYYRLMAGKELPLEQERETTVEDLAPPYLSQHTVLHASWSYLPSEKQTHSMAFLMPPPYHSTKTVYIPSKSESDCDRNMNNTLTSNKNLKLGGHDEYGFELRHPRVSRDGLERGAGGGSMKHNMSEARNEEVLRRVAEMQKMVESSERYLNEHGEYCHEFDTSVDVESDCESLNSSKQSSNEDAPGVLRHSDSLTLLSETINQGLDGIAKGLNSIYTAPFSEVNGRLDNNSAQSTPKTQRKVQGLSQILSDLQALGNDLSQSESDSESLYTPNSSPIHNKNANQMPQTSLRNKTLRTSFGLHSPDSSVLGCDTKDMNLKEYLRQLKEASSGDSAGNTDLAAKKIAELYGYEIGEETIIETDPDIIDLRSIPPPQTPDELDNLNVLNVPPTGFDDGDLEEFLKKVTIEPPTQKITPAVELTPEEILSYIIPPPPGLADSEPGTNQTKPSALKTNPSSLHQIANNNTTNAKNLNHAANANKSTIQSEKTNGHVIEYPTVDRKGPFSCCTKTKKEKTEEASDQQTPNGALNNDSLALPPKRCPHTPEKSPPPERPPKSAELQLKLNSPVRSPNYAKTNGNSGNYYEMDPPSLPPRFEKQSTSPPPVILSTLPPKKPPLPPVPQKPCIRTFNRDELSDKSSSPVTHSMSPTPTNRQNGHYRSHSDCPPMSRKTNLSNPGSPILSNKNGHILNVDTLMSKTDVAMAGLLVKLDQVAAMCSAAQTAGGGTSIDEEKFQRAKDELTDQSLHLVTSSKHLVVSMSDANLTNLPEHLTACLSALRRITELAQDLTRYTSAPLQTRNIVLKIHDVASSFRELACVRVGPQGAGQLALHAECLANVLATLLRSLRVFSP